MPKLLKAGVAGLLCASGLDAWLGRRPPELPLILGYHRVVEDGADQAECLPGMVISQRSLRAQLEWVARRCRIVSLDELGAHLEDGGSGAGLAAITFDDGYRDVYEHGLPLLERMGLPAAVFVVTGSLSTGTPLLHDRLYQIVSEAARTRRPLPPPLAALLPRAGGSRARSPLATTRALLASAPAARLLCLLDDASSEGGWQPPPRALDPVDWHTLLQLQRAGITIGSHTHSHALLASEDTASVCDELQRSRRELVAGLGTEVDHFAYPDGSFNAHVVRAVAAAGYRFAYTICTHRDRAHPLLTLPRVMLWEGSCSARSGTFSPSLLACHARGVLPLREFCQRQHLIGSLPC